jgi:hypothetical protein
MSKFWVKLLQKVKLIEDKFDESNSIIGYLPDKEETIVKYSLRSKLYENSIMKKLIKSGRNDEKQLKHASTEVAYTFEEIGDRRKYEDIVNFVREQQQQQTIFESVVICCTTQSNNPLDYQAVQGGPLDPIEPASLSKEMTNLSDSKSCDLIIFGPSYTSLHADFLYSRRNSLIPSWNKGVIKIWIIRKSSSSKTNRFERTSFNRVMSKSFQPYDEIKGVLSRPDDFLLLIQTPGQAIRHNGRHYHCVITAFDTAVNPNMLSMSLGRKDSYSQDKLDYCKAALPTDLLVDSGGSAKKARRKLFIKTYLNKLDKSRRRFAIKQLNKQVGLVPKKQPNKQQPDKQQPKKRPKKQPNKQQPDEQQPKKRRRRGGFQKGNKHNPKQRNSRQDLKVLKPNRDFLYTFFVY